MIADIAQWLAPRRSGFLSRLKILRLRSYATYGTFQVEMTGCGLLLDGLPQGDDALLSLAEHLTSALT